MNFSNHEFQFSIEFSYAVASELELKMSLQLYNHGFLCMKRQEMVDFMNMQLMGAEIAQ